MQNIFLHSLESSKTRKRLCVILISPQTGSSPDEDRKRNALRNFVAEHKFNPERVRFTYIYKDRQRSFVNALELESEDDNLVILWRIDEYNLKYQWLSK